MFRVIPLNTKNKLSVQKIRSWVPVMSLVEVLPKFAEMLEG
jgi:hypothetical protein